MDASGLSYVLLEYGARRRRRYVLSATDIAVAVDAADDLEGKVRLDLDLIEASSWEALRIER
jgi:hypothetical protein